ncbi:MAG: heavy metal sensor histidine kinase [Alphaproteobacteria bacterium]|nr:heavy metal sensor histidine kinase [Alphaproteobacteria bacterium]MDE2075339.1 heavy metal sensor histidine kinase [Alphaproteobacteria bacterium]
MTLRRANRTLSIGARLTLSYTLITLMVMVVFAVVADWRLGVNFGAEHARFLEAKAAELQADLNDDNGHPDALIAEIMKETTGTRLREYEARVFAADGQMLGETPGMAGTIPVSDFPALDAGRARPFAAGGHQWVLALIRLKGLSRPQDISIQIALDVSRDAALLKDMRRAMVFVLLLLVPVLVLAGRFVSARGLAPLHRIVTAAGGVTPVQLSARIPLEPPWPAELVGLVSVFNAMLGRLEEAFARLTRFSADLAHELRTPLGNLSGELEVSLMRPRSAEEYRATLESGLEECRRLNSLIEDLLFMARAEHAELVLHRQRFAAAQAAEWVIAQQTTVAARKAVQIAVSGDTPVDADPVLFRQALTNLLGNALRHAPPGSAVAISIAADADGAATVAVHNSGEPISPEHLPHLFDRFYQADPARSAETGRGTGLGLSIVRTIMDLHGGDVRIESTQENGTTVTLYFPAIPSAE